MKTIKNEYLQYNILFRLDTPPSSKYDAFLTPNFFSPDILSPMSVHLQQNQNQNNNNTTQTPIGFPPAPPGPPDQQIFSLHVMIDSYRRAAKYLLDTANHLELVARHGNHGNMQSANTPKNAANKKTPAPDDENVSKKEEEWIYWYNFFIFREVRTRSLCRLKKSAMECYKWTNAVILSGFDTLSCRLCPISEDPEFDFYNALFHPFFYFWLQNFSMLTRLYYRYIFQNTF